MPASAAAAPRFASPRAYTPPHLANRILTSRAALEGERKLVTVLFADISGFTEWSDRQDPEEVHRIMTRVFELLLAQVHRYEGTINQFLGDGIMALFGAPLACEDHARRAVAAALAIQSALEKFAADLRPRDITLQVRQGLNTGLVVVGSIGNDLRMDYTAIGDTTNVAHRLMDAAAPSRIVISEATHRAVAGYARTQELGLLMLKGKETPVQAWEVMPGGSPRTRLEIESERGLTTFIGREGELALLAESWRKAQAGHGQIVFVAGEPGIGKSRLIFEFRQRLGPDAAWLEAHCVATNAATPFYPIIELLRQCFGIVESTPNIVECIEESVLARGEDLRPGLPFLRYLLGVDPGDPAVVTMDPKQRRAWIFDAVRRLLARAAEAQPYVIVYEDVQWMDQASEELLLAISDIIPTGRITQVLTYRTGYHHPFGEHTYHRRIMLDALSLDDSVQMARAITGLPGTLARDVEALIVAKADGNPFFLEEIVKSLHEVGLIKPGAVLPSDAVVVPDTVNDLIMARIDRLPEPQKMTLQIASVIGRQFSRRLLDLIEDARPRDSAVLADLVTAELIYEKSLSPELSYTFRHALTQEVAYNSLLIERRRQLHGDIGAAMEQLYAERLTEHCEELAHHFSRADDRAKARDYLVLAGDKATRAFANRDARALYDRALALAPPDDRQSLAAVHAKLATITQYLGDADASLRHGQTAATIYEAIGDGKNAVAQHLHIHALYIWQWDGEREDMGLNHLQAALRFVEHQPDSVEKALVYQRTGHGYLHRSEPATALAWAQKAADMLSRLQVKMGTSMGTALAYTGQVDAGLAYNEANWELVQKAGIPVVMAVFGHDISLTLALLRDVSRARAWAERLLPEVAKASNVFEVMLRRPLAIIYSLAGDHAAASRMCQAIESIEGQKRLGCVYEDAAAVGFHYLGLGDLDRSQRYLESALKLYLDRRNLVAAAGCRLVLGWSYLESGKVAEAEAQLTESLNVSRVGGNVLLELWILPLLAELAIAASDPDKAAAHVERGFEMLASPQDWRGIPGPMLRARGAIATARRQWDEAQTCFERAIDLHRRYDLPGDEGRTLVAWAELHQVQDPTGGFKTAREKLDRALEIFNRVGAQKEAARASMRREVLKG